MIPILNSNEETWYIISLKIELQKLKIQYTTTNSKRQAFLRL